MILRMWNEPKVLGVLAEPPCFGPKSCPGRNRSAKRIQMFIEVHYQVVPPLKMIGRGLVQQIQLLGVARRSPKHERVAFVSPRRRDNKSFAQARSQSTTSSSKTEQAKSWLVRGSSIRVSTLFTALLALGAGATALGLCVCPISSQGPCTDLFQITTT